MTVAASLIRIFREGGVPALGRAFRVQLQNNFLTITADEGLRIRREVGAHLFSSLDGEVQSGFAKGMKLAVESETWSSGDLVSYLLGSYEIEVQNELLRISGESNGIFVDVGAATGYFAVGSVLNRHFAHSIAFEMDPKNQRAIDSQARKNGVANQIDLRGEFTQTSLDHFDFPLAGAVILMDVEGAEFGILSSHLIEQIKHSHLILEIHNWMTSEWELNALRKRLETRFMLREIRSGVRDPNHQLLDHLRDDVRWLLVSEGRHERGTWWICTPRSERVS
jgi:hypothetical protein